MCAGFASGVLLLLMFAGFVVFSLWQSVFIMPHENGGVLEVQPSISPNINIDERVYVYALVKADQNDLEGTLPLKQDCNENAPDSHHWIIDKEASKLSFSGAQYGQRFDGQFDFDGKIIFDPDNLQGSMAEIIIDIASVSTGSLERDSWARSALWFDVLRHPQAVFRTLEIARGKKQGDYIARGLLKVHGVEILIDLPFYLQFYDISEDIGRPFMVRADEREDLALESVDPLVLVSEESTAHVSFFGVFQSIRPVHNVFGGEDLSLSMMPPAELAGDHAYTRFAKRLPDIEMPHVEMFSKISLRRSDFGIGTGQKEINEAVDDNVDVYIFLRAHKAVCNEADDYRY